MSQRNLLWKLAVTLLVVLAASGCATRRYARSRVKPVDARVTQLETQVNEQMAAMSSKEQADISQVNERIATTDMKVDQVASAVQQAQGSASRAMQESQANQAKLAAERAELAALSSGVANSLNFQLVEKADVTFKSNQATLTPEAKIALNQIAMKIQSLPRAVVELAGFTDPVGSPTYNLALSRRRADAVQRYLVLQKVPLRFIHIVGLGEEAPPEALAADLLAVDPNASKADMYRLARRVKIRVYGAGDIVSGSAARSQ